MTALVETEHAARGAGSARPGQAGALDFIGADLAAHYPGSMLVVDAKARASAVNKQAEALAEILNGAQHNYLIARRKLKRRSLISSWLATSAPPLPLN